MHVLLETFIEHCENFRRMIKEFAVSSDPGSGSSGLHFYGMWYKCLVQGWRLYVQQSSHPSNPRLSTQELNDFTITSAVYFLACWPSLYVCDHMIRSPTEQLENPCQFRSQETKLYIKAATILHVDATHELTRAERAQSPNLHEVSCNLVRTQT